MGLLRRYLDWRLRNVAAVETSSEGFMVHRGASSREIRWASVDVVIAFKRDHLTVDCLCIIVESDGIAIELDEGMAGFDPWLRSLEAQFSIAEEWRFDVLFPPFESNVTEIFRRFPVSASPTEQA